ncbi:uncharacterized protein UTRI_05974_B [Ustilago trichophora]|uniref:RlpA-like protein double-psi beta-barrel domain-containing protein n=1 Tax=Ustilago trichophora TaxID=86804 RepID=A0A5C3EMA4_9BASI|nr:uncharacterized protein UTRI_05974_B [Ustilago trichophora]
MQIINFFLFGTLAILTLTTSSTQALPTGLHRAHHHRGIAHSRRSASTHRRDDDHGDVSAHDGYEAHLHALEAALQHYNDYGDDESLNFYLNGFAGGVDDPAQNSAQSKDDDGEKGASKQDGSDDKQVGDDKQNKDDCEDGDGESKSVQTEPQPEPEPQPQQPSQNKPKMKKTHKKPKQEQPSNNYVQPEQPKEQPQPAQAQDPTTPPEISNPAPSTGNNDGKASNGEKGSSKHHTGSSDNNSGNSINGYTPPSFSTSSSPSTSSLYTQSTPFTGHATYYDTGLGACGIVNTDTDPIVAVSKDLFEQYNPSSGNPNHNSLCGRKVEISWKGKKTHAFAMDECPTCYPTSLDMSPSVFEALDCKDVGDLNGIQWRFI